MKIKFLTLVSIAFGLLFYTVCVTSNNQPQWSVLKTVPFPGKQDDIFFINRNSGWYVNGKGFIYNTNDGGNTWSELIHKPGTFFRAIGFVDSNIGFAGNIGPDYFPNVTDPQPLYQTQDGGKTWSAIEDLLPADIKGICAIDVLKSSFIDSGILKERTTIYAAGRVGGPAKLVISQDNGLTWKKHDLSSQAAMIQDVKFINESTGFICAGSDPDVEQSHARILKTIDGGTSWKIVYESKRPFELIWKCTFPTDDIGYATVLNYDKDSAQKVVLKTTDRGDSWQELPLTNDATVKEFGIGFVDENTGWVGAAEGVWKTTNGGSSWTHEKVGHAINKIRVIKDEQGTVVYGIGSEVIKLEL
jgi:photosystem II stability/assembly factor-like uncharacterized protein